MKKTIFILASMLCFSSFADDGMGPFPHERMHIQTTYYAKDPLSNKYIPKTADKEDASGGTYIYLGEVPKFKAEELELTISKMALTNRVTAYVNQERIDQYAQELFLRWKTVDDAVKDSRFSFHPLMTLRSMVPSKNHNMNAWVTIAEQYSSHILESTGANIYGEKRNTKNFATQSDRDAYKETISDAYFMFLFQTKDRADKFLNDNMLKDNLVSVSNSRRLFDIHLGKNFTKDSTRDGYLGFLTFVYPIAATVKGPFDQPAEGVYKMQTSGSMESRLWSDKWDDEFGGFPFLLIEPSGVAFHGPITSYSPLDVWFLRRGFVSHGCHRMDTSDILELRMLFPTDLVKSNNKIKTTVLNHVDVTDFNRDGKLEAIDVKYYSIPTSIAVGKKQTLESIISPFMIETQMQTFFNKNVYSEKFYQAKTDSFLNLPRYVVENNKLKKSGVHDIIPVHRFEYRKNRIIQYKEEGAKLRGYEEVIGKWPPRKFQIH